MIETVNAQIAGGSVGAPQRLHDGDPFPHSLAWGGEPSESITEAFPEKPKGMHWRRYSRLRRRHTQAFERSLMGLAKSTERLERWLFR
jgi:hypothetical protein